MKKTIAWVLLFAFVALFAGVQGVLAAERTVVLKIPDCG